MVQGSGGRFVKIQKGWIGISPRNRSKTLKICAHPNCHEEIPAENIPASYGTEEKIYYFHKNCFQMFVDAHGRTNFIRIQQALRQFDRMGFEPTVELNGVGSGLKEHIPSFEPPPEKKLAYLELIQLFLAHYNKPMSRKQIAYETGIPYTTVTWRIWENLPEQSKDPCFVIKGKGPRGVELVGLIEHE